MLAQDWPQPTLHRRCQPVPLTLLCRLDFSGTGGRHGGTVGGAPRPFYVSSGVEQKQSRVLVKK